jgi:hypothetical protein
MASALDFERGRTSSGISPRRRVSGERVSLGVICGGDHRLLQCDAGLLLKFITLPLEILTFGLFFLVVNAIVLWFSGKFVPGFVVTNLGSFSRGARAGLDPDPDWFSGELP